MADFTAAGATAEASAVGVATECLATLFGVGADAAADAAAEADAAEVAEDGRLVADAVLAIAKSAAALGLDVASASTERRMVEFRQQLGQKIRIGDTALAFFVNYSQK